MRIRLMVEEANLFSEESLIPHFTGSDAVLSCIGSYLGFANFFKVTLYSETGRPIISAMQKACVQRFVCITSWCTKYNRNDPGPFVMEWIVFPLFRAILKDMARLEDILLSEDSSDINFTIVRPPQLTNSPSKGQEILVEERQFVKGGCRSTPRVDVAKFMLSALSTDKYDRKAVAIDCAKLRG
ncbi:flavin reductase (NADPH)-like isoform X2 [Ptychodera flava]|uniref:flavin reductase (NADPH)-like isoform X2 n=1 Tax=Ptychodera flava TaxID=63121 RepID=UPI003969C7CB